MKKKNDLKKLAQMGMLAGMLLSVDHIDAKSGNSIDSSYLAGKCGAGKCNSVAASCASQHNSCTQVAERAPSNYYQSNCNSGAAPQGYYDPSQTASNSQNNQPNNKYTGNNQSNSKQQQGGQQGNQGQNNNSKYQANNGCSGHGGCSSQPPSDYNNAGRYQASGCSGQRQPAANNSNAGGYYNPNQVAEADTKVTPPKLNEADLLNKLNAQGKSTYNSLSADGKKLALQLANADCKGKNECKGLNSCKTDKNACAGKGGCKAQSACSFKDKNLAVKVAATKMAEKRAGLQNKNGNSN